MARTLPDVLKWTPEHTRRTTRYLAVAAVVVVALLGGLFVLDRLRVANRSKMLALVQYQRQVSLAGELLRDMETGQRGFLLTGQDSFLDPYRRAQGQLPALFNQLRSQASTIGPDGPGQISAFVESATTWENAAAKTLDLRRQSGATPDSNQEAVATGKALFDALRTRQQAVDDYVRAQLDTVNQSYNTIYPWVLILLTLVTVMVVGTVAYCQSLVQRLGQLAAFLQVRQDRVQAYNRVVTTLNGPTELQPLLQAALPTILETVGGQAGAIYMLEQGVLRPAMTMGFNADGLPGLRLGEGLPGVAIQQNRLVATNDLPADTPYQINVGIGVAPARNVVSLPLRFGNQLLGALTVASVGTIGEEETHQLRLATSQLATAISNVRSFEDLAEQREELRQSNAEIARRLEENETLQEMGRELANQRDLQPLLQLICREARHLIQADYTAVATQVDRDGATKWVATDGTRTSAAMTTIFPPGQGTAGRVIAQKGPIIQGPLTTPELRAEFAVHAAEEMQECFGVPLFHKDQPVGALIVAYRRPQAISDEMIDLATSLAAYGSVAIDNARLLEELSDERDLVAARALELEEKNREVERATRLKSEFVANMSHELRTPLNSILALSQIMGDELDGTLNGEQRKQIEIIERNGQNLLRLINDILDLSKIEAGKLDLLPSTFTPQDLLENVRTVVWPLVSGKGLQLVLDVAPELPRLMTDENKLKQVLLNLLSNAVKFTEQGTITIAARSGREIGGGQQTRHSPQWITFEVSDTGIGIAPENLPSIWEEFEQVDGSLSRRYEGTGLGLTIVRRLVGLLGGEIVVRSVLNNGSNFIFSIPVQLAKGPQVIAVEDVSQTVNPESRTAMRLREHGKPVVLIVDDDPEVIYILEKYLRDDGYGIEVAHTGDEAINKARQLHPFAMTLDVMLPGRDGWDVIQTLKGDPLTADIPIIMLSMLDNRQLGYSLGASDYLVKPVSRNDLLQRLERLRNGHPLQSVLVVDDDPIQQRVISTTLRDAGMTVVTCPNGIDALQWLQDHTPDLITLDLMMPGMDGFTVLEEIKHRETLHAVPVLIITAKEITPEDRRRLNSRIAAIIEKGPSERNELLREVHVRLEHHRVKLARSVEVPDE
ncbi:MAG: response regulator [Herpetosiphonaceae bacterium]|nr:response regulator [Herpetosiphonaceae bacterium]